MKIPYGKTYLELGDVPVSTEYLAAEAEPGDKRTEDEIVLAAMENPIGSPTLRSLAAGKKSAVIILSDHTRPVPSRRMVPHLLRELRSGNADIEITLLVATGCHRGTTKDELAAKLGREMVENERILVHDCMDDGQMVDVGELPSGARLVVNRAALETDLLLAEGFIEPHFFAGFSGGRKSILPGICSRSTVLGNHCARFIQNGSARAGCLEGNPIQADMVEACRMVGLEYILNVILDEDKRIAAAYAGQPEEAHQRGCEDLFRRCRVRPRKKGDIVLVSNGGAPLDQNVYQAVKGLSTAEFAAAEGAVLIICAECADGLGGDAFFEAVRDCASPAELYEEIKQVPMEETKPDQWQVQILARILAAHRVIFVTRPELAASIEAMKMTYAPDIAQALGLARAIKGGDCHHVVIPDGVSVVVEAED